MLRSLRPKLAALMNNKIMKRIFPKSNIVTISSLEEEHVDMDIHDFQYQEYLQREEIDGWEIRRCFNEMLGIDAVPHPQTIIAGLHACRRVNDCAMAIRFLEGCRFKCGAEACTIYPYLLQEILPTLAELGLPTIEEIGYDEPELYLKPIELVEIDQDGCPCDEN